MPTLNDIQKDTVKKWIEEGCGLNDIQRRLTSELQLNLTYMDVRFLVIDLGLQVKEKKVTEPITNLKTAATTAPAAGAAAPIGPDSDLPAGGIQLEVDRITRPGSVISGTVTFSDGVAAKWMLDQQGRLGLDAGKPGYRPSQEDLQEFQMILSQKLQSQGY
jgi:hypothetical protein